MSERHVILIAVIIIFVSIWILWLDNGRVQRPLTQRHPLQFNFQCRTSIGAAASEQSLTPEILYTEDTDIGTIRIRQFHPFRDRIDINHAPVRLLDTLPGINPTLAERIFEERILHGSFKSIDDLSRVKGLTADKIDQIRSLIKIERRQ